MLVEAHARCDALDITWVRFAAILSALPTYQRIAAGKPISHEERIQQQKDSRYLEL
jgi:hypothetical protein